MGDGLSVPFIVSCCKPVRGRQPNVDKFFLQVHYHMVNEIKDLAFLIIYNKRG